MSMTIPKSLQSQRMNRFLALKELSVRQWSFLELTEDPLFDKIRPERYAEYIDTALADAREKAGAYGIASLRDWMAGNDIGYEVVTSGSPMLIHSETVLRNGRITIKIYEDVIRELSDCIEAIGLRMETETLMTLHLAHEFYHCLEYRNETDLSRKCPAVDYRFMGLITRKGYVSRTREIAAHAYAGEVCGLSFHPKFLDYLLWERKEPETADAYYRSCMECVEKWKGDL